MQVTDESTNGSNINISSIINSITSSRRGIGITKSTFDPSDGRKTVADRSDLTLSKVFVSVKQLALIVILLLLLTI